MQQNEKGFSVVEIIMAVVIVGLIGVVAWMWSNNQNTSKTTQNSTQSTEKKSDNNNKKSEVVATPTPLVLASGTFGKAGNYGTAQMRGYAIVTHENLGYPGCDTDPSCKYDAVRFYITETPNTHLLAYLQSFADSGNLLATKDSFNMGCLKNGKINYTTYSDAKGTQNLTLNESTTSALTSATKEKPVALEIEELKSTGGIDGMCLSLFTDYTLLK